MKTSDYKFIAIWILIFMLAIWGAFFIKNKTQTDNPLNEWTWTVSTATWVKIPVSENKTTTLSWITVWTREIKDVEVLSVVKDWKELSKTIFLNRKKDEKLEDYLKRIWKSNACFLAEYNQYMFQVANSNSWVVTFDNQFNLYFDNKWNTIKIMKLIKTPVTQKEYLEKNIGLKTMLENLNKSIWTEKNEEVKKRMQTSLDSQIKMIPTFILTEELLDSKASFEDIMKHYESPEFCKTNPNIK